MRFIFFCLISLLSSIPSIAVTTFTLEYIKSDSNSESGTDIIIERFDSKNKKKDVLNLRYAYQKYKGYSDETINSVLGFLKKHNVHVENQDWKKRQVLALNIKESFLLSGYSVTAFSADQTEYQEYSTQLTIRNTKHIYFFTK
jgi:rRNA maturation protein Rpf1